MLLKISMIEKKKHKVSLLIYYFQPVNPCPHIALLHKAVRSPCWWLFYYPQHTVSKVALFIAIPAPEWRDRHEGTHTDGVGASSGTGHTTSSHIPLTRTDLQVHTSCKEVLARQPHPSYDLITIEVGKNKLCWTTSPFLLNMDLQNVFNLSSTDGSLFLIYPYLSFYL